MSDLTTKALTRLALTLSASALLLMACGDDEAGGDTPCADDSACPTGQVCADSGVCDVLECESNADCLTGDQACIEHRGQRVCSLVECGCANCDPCAAGHSCDNGVCVLGGGTADCPGGTHDECGDGEVCDNFMCRACEGAECGATPDCTVDGCDPGFECDPATKACEPVSTVDGETCASCTNADECGGGGWTCAPLINGNSCLPPCTTNDDCYTGWLCQAGACTPVNFTCSGCMLDGCAAGEACNPNDSACIPATAACESCGNDWECGAGSACHDSACLPRCVDGGCPDGGACVTSANQVQVCADACQAGCDPACGGATPYCVDGGCVQCRSDADCMEANGERCGATGMCEGGLGDCVAPTPYYWNGSCVECYANEHCAGGFCNSETHVCGSDVCASCADPYPACTQIGDDHYCVQCTSDRDCGLGGTCNNQTFACEGGTVTNTDPCTSDADCDDGGVSGYTLKCDEPSGYCYDANGRCDDVSAFCPGTDGVLHPCKSLLDLLGEMGLPTDLGGGVTLPGNCTCSPGTCMDDITCSKDLLDGAKCLAAQDPGACFTAWVTNDEWLCGSQL